eukprot:gene10536-11673_t
MIAFAPKGIFLIFTCFVATAALVDFYQTLGLPRAASQQDIDLAYRQLSSAFACEVDASGKGNSALLEAVAHAYEVLGDPARRQLYDKTYLAQLHRTAKEDTLLFSQEEISALQPRTIASELAEMLREGQQSAIEQIESLRTFTRSNGVFVVFLCIFTLGLAAFYLRPFRELQVEKERVSVENSEEQELTPAPVQEEQEEEVGTPDDEAKWGEERVEEVIRPSVLVDVAVSACPPSSFAVVSPTPAPAAVNPQTVPILAQEHGPVSSIGIDLGYKIRAVPLSAQSLSSSRPMASHQDYSSSHSGEAEREERINQLASAVPTPMDASSHAFQEASLNQVPDTSSASELKEESPNKHALEQSGVTTPIRNTDVSGEGKRLTGTKRRIDAIKSKRESNGLEEVEKKIRLELVH